MDFVMTIEHTIAFAVVFHRVPHEICRIRENLSHGMYHGIPHKKGRGGVRINGESHAKHHGVSLHHGVSFDKFHMGYTKGHMVSCGIPWHVSW